MAANFKIKGVHLCIYTEPWFHDVVLGDWSEAVRVKLICKKWQDDG